jgi:hypothetical protein
MTLRYEIRIAAQRAVPTAGRARFWSVLDNIVALVRCSIKRQFGLGHSPAQFEYGVLRRATLYLRDENAEPQRFRSKKIAAM